MLPMLRTKQSSRNDMDGKRMQSLRPLCNLFVVDSRAAIWDCYIRWLRKTVPFLSVLVKQLAARSPVLAVGFCGENEGAQKLI